MTRPPAHAFGQQVASDLHPPSLQHVRRRLTARLNGAASCRADIRLVSRKRAASQLGCDPSIHARLPAAKARREAHPAFALPPVFSA